MSCKHFFPPETCLFCRDEEIERLRDKNRDLNRRCQTYEKAIAEKVKANPGPSLGKYLAIGHAMQVESERDTAIAETERLRADLIEERRAVTRLLDDHGRACVRAEQAEDRAEKAERERDALRFTQTSGAYAVCAKHPRIFSPDKRMPCPACDRDAAIAAIKRAEAVLSNIADNLRESANDLTRQQCIFKLDVIRTQAQPWTKGTSNDD